MKKVSSKKDFIRVILAFFLILQLCPVAVAIASSCTIGDLRQGIWIWQDSTTCNCFYYTGPPYAPWPATIRSSGTLTSHEVIQKNYKFVYYTTIWNASPSSPVVSYMSGSPGDATCNEKCWYYAQLFGYTPQIGNTSPLEGLYSAGKAIWKWTDKNCDKEEPPPAPTNTSNPDTGRPECNDQAL